MSDSRGARPLHPDSPAHGTGAAAIRPSAVGKGSRPSGYPREYELFVELRDGGRIRVRPILPGDAPALKQDGNTDAIMALDRTQVGAIISRLASPATTAASANAAITNATSASESAAATR